MDLTTHSAPATVNWEVPTRCVESVAKLPKARRPETWTKSIAIRFCNEITEYHWLMNLIYSILCISTNQCMNHVGANKTFFDGKLKKLAANRLSSPLGSSNQLDVHDQNPHCHKQKGWCNGVPNVSTIIIETSRATFSPYSMLPRGIPLRSPAHRDVGPVPWQHPTPPVSVPRDTKRKGCTWY